ncbi:hypothetical protein ABK040_009843 [Willaertia magna]
MLLTTKVIFVIFVIVFLSTIFVFSKVEDDSAIEQRVFSKLSPVKRKLVSSLFNSFKKVLNDPLHSKTFNEQALQRIVNERLGKDFETKSAKQDSLGASPFVNWMERFVSEDSNVGNIPLRLLAIPGTHDSFTHEITATSRLSPDAEDNLREIYKIKWIPRSVLGQIIARWSKAQQRGALGQLQDGIRYFDIRVCRDNTTSDVNEMFKTCHGLYSSRISTILDDVSTFSSVVASKEVIILDFNHFYAMNSDFHSKLRDLIISKLGREVLLSTKQFSVQSTLNDIWRTNQRIMVIYHDSPTVSSTDGSFWYGSTIDNFWPNVQNLLNLQSFSVSKLADRSSSTLFVTQGVLTPDSSMIAKGFLNRPSSLMDLADSVTPAVLNWIAQKLLDINKFNIIITDWYNRFDYVSAIVNINKAKRI